jgi:osmoprotectant transport system ATP-binding protein
MSDPAAEPAPPDVPASPVLSLAGASRSFDGKLALAPLDLDIARGETVALIGPSGCGKTTILRLALGLLTPDAGVVRFRGQRLTPANLRAARRQMGYVVQEGGLFPHLTAAENVDLLARHLGWDEPRRARRRAELAELARLPADALARYPLQLSGGQRQRVSLMRALMLDPELVLLDEPLGAIDPLVRAELQEDLARIFERLRKAVLLVTHDLAEAAFFSHRVLLLRDGRVVQRGRVAELVRSPAEPFVTRFVAAQRRLAIDEPGGHA